MVIAGEASGDMLAAELVKALQEELTTAEGQPTADAQPLHASLAPRFFGAGGPSLREAGVDLAFDMTQHAVIGLVEVLKHYGKFRKLFNQLLALAIEQKPHVIICVDFSGFNRRFAHAVKEYVRGQQGLFFNWNPKIIQYVSPQVWASRPGRARKLAQDIDLLLTIFPFEKNWYATRVPNLRVEFVGHPSIDRYARLDRHARQSPVSPPLALLLPGSRSGELKRHLPVMLEAARQIQTRHPVRWRMVLPNSSLAEQAQAHLALQPGIELRIGGLAESLAEAKLALASTGTVTMECAYFGVPTIALYKTSWSTYQIGKRIITVEFLAMPNLLAGEPIFPEFIQHEATPENIVREALDLLSNPARREAIKTKLVKVMQSLGEPGASQRAAHSILKLLWNSERGGEGIKAGLRGKS